MKCAARTKAGTQCTRNAVSGSDFCKQHALGDLGNVHELFERYEVPPDCAPLVDAYGRLGRRLKEASAKIERDGLILFTKAKGEHPNPAVLIERQTAAELARIHREIVRSSKPVDQKSKKSGLDELAAKRKARRAGPATAKA